MITDTEKLVNDLAEQITQKAIAKAKESPDFQAKMERYPDSITKYRENQLFIIKESANLFLEKGEPLYRKFRCGAFHPSNKFTRSLFTSLTNVKLPATVKGTDEQLRNYIGLDICHAIELREKEEKELEEAMKEEIKLEEYNKQVEKIKTAIMDNFEITGDELVMVARHYGLAPHPRTVGMLRKRVTLIKEGTARITKGGSVQSAFGVYNQVKSLIMGVGLTSAQ